MTSISVAVITSLVEVAQVTHCSLGLSFSTYKIAMVNFSFLRKCFKLLREPPCTFASKPALLLTAHQSIVMTVL